MSKYNPGVRVYSGSSYFNNLNTANKTSQQTNANLQFAANTRLGKEANIPKPTQTKKPVAFETYYKRENEKSFNNSSYTYLGNQPPKKMEVEKTNLQANNPLKTSQTLQKKPEESPQLNKGIVEYNREYFIQVYVKEALNDIITGKFNPAVGSLKNYSPKIFDALAVFNTQFNLKLEQLPSLQNLMTIIKSDYLSLSRQRSQKEGRSYYETNEKTKLQKLPHDRVYEEVRRFLSERPSTAKTNDIRQQPAQLAKKEMEIKELINKNQKANLQLRDKDDNIAKLNKQLEAFKGEIKKLNEELLKERQRSKDAASTSLRQNELANQVKQLKADLASYGTYKPSDFQTLKEGKSKSDKDADMLRDELNKLKSLQQSAQRTSIDSYNLKNENERLKRQKESVGNELLLLKSKNEENARARMNMQAENEKLKKQLDRLKADYDKMTKENNTLKTQSFEGSEQKRRKENETKRYLEHIQQVTREFEEHKKLSSSKDQKYRSIEDDLAKASRSITQLKNNEKKYQQKLAELTKENSSLTEERDNLKYKIINMEITMDMSKDKKQKDQIQMAIKEKSEEIERLKASNKTATTNYETIKKSYDSLNLFYEQMANENKKITQEKSNLEQALLQKDKQISPQQLPSKNNYLVKPNEADNGKVATLQNQVKQLKQDLAQKDKELLDLKNKLKAANEEIDQLNEKEFNLSGELLTACKEVEELQTKLHNMERERTTIRNDEKQKDKYQKQLKQKQTEIDELLQQVNSLNQILADREGDERLIEESQSRRSNEIEKLTAQIQSQEKLINNLNKTIKQLEKNLMQQQQRKGTESPNQKFVRDLQAQNKRLQQKVLSLESSAKKGSNNGGNQANRINLLYQHLILDGQFQYKNFLTEKIETHCRLQIKKTKLIYYFDPLNKVNFHRYIDKVDNLLVIVKTGKGAILAGYSQGSFQPKKIAAHDGLIISITNHQVFTLVQPNKRAITYDDYYLIFGNSELRIRSQQAKIFSNFGISNSYYVSRSKKVSDLLGGTPQEREVDIEGYEIYQIIFNDY